MDFSLTDEQRDFVAAIENFCRRECGTREQRAALTKRYTELHSQEIYRRMAELGWLGVTIPEEYGGSCGGVARPRSDRRLRDHPDRRGGHPAVRDRGAEARHPRRDRVGDRRGDRDD